jgi:excisionase family DNA binding protein
MDRQTLDGEAVLSSSFCADVGREATSKATTKRTKLRRSGRAFAFEPHPILRHAGEKFEPQREKTVRRFDLSQNRLHTMNHDDLPRFLTAQEFADEIRQHRETVYPKLRNGEIPGAKKVGGSWRIPRWALDEMGTPAHLEHA